jgi:hypothetical protein
MRTFITIISAGAANAWFDSGHLLTARRAYDILETNNPDVLNAANAMLSVLNRHEPSLTSSEGDYPFVECATFADEIKGKGYTW